MDGGGGGDGGGSAAGGGGGGEGATEKLVRYRFLAQLCPREAGERAGEAIGREPNLRAVLRLVPGDIVDPSHRNIGKGFAH